MIVYEVPLTPNAQKFRIPLAGTTYRLRVYWCAPAACWMLDLFSDDDLALVTGIPIVTGVDLLAQYSYLNFPGELWAETDHAPDAVPTDTNLGTTGHLYFVVP